MNEDDFYFWLDVAVSAIIAIAVLAAAWGVESHCRRAERAAYLEGRYGLNHAAAMRFVKTAPQVDPREWHTMADLGRFALNVLPAKREAN